MIIYKLYTDELEDVKIAEGFFDGWLNPPDENVHRKILSGSFKSFVAIHEEKKEIIGYINVISDGVLTALKLADIMVEKSMSMESLVNDCQTYPQVLEKVMVENKKEIMELEVIQNEIDRIAQELGSDGRILVRPSGTEPVIRVMVEAKEHDVCETYVSDMIKVINNI